MKKKKKEFLLKEEQKKIKKKNKTKIKISETLKINNHSSIKLYVYNENLELINNKLFFTIKKTAEFLGIKRSKLKY